MKLGITNFRCLPEADHGKVHKMVLVERKCPNCGAILKLKPGDHDVRCDYCRSEFGVEYEDESTHENRPFGITLEEACQAIARLTRWET